MTRDDPTADLGDVTKEGDRFVLRFERRFDHPREKVWRAITESEHLAHWMPCDIVGERAAGATLQLPFWPAHIEKYGDVITPELQVLEGRIEVWDPPTVFEWWWSTDRLRFELDETDDGGTVLRFTTWVDPDPEGAGNAAAGYHQCLANLTDLLDTGSTAPLISREGMAPLEAVYADRVADA